MSTEVRWRRGTTAEHDTFTGAAGEVTVDSTQNKTVVHDGTNPGGHPSAKDSEVLKKTGNLSELVDKVVAFDNIKQDATLLKKGVIRLASTSETQEGTATSKAVTPESLKSLTASATRRGLVELATPVETQAGTDDLRAVTSKGLHAVTATPTRRGLVELATLEETEGGTDGERAVTPEGLTAYGSRFAPITRSRKNLLINGGFAIWQRGTSFSSTSGVEFGADRWAVYADSSSTHTQDRMEFALGQTEVPGNPSYFMKMTWLSSQEVIRRELRQKIENVKQFSGKRFTLSFWAKVSSAQTGAIFPAFSYGGGSATETLPLIDIDFGTSWEKHVVQIDAPDMSGKTIGNLSDSHLNLAFRFDTDVGNELSIAQVQLEAGDTATDFEYRPIGEELALCQRYYQESHVSLYFYDTSESPLGRVIRPFYMCSEMRAQAVITHSFSTGGAVTVDAVVHNFPSAMFTVDATATSGYQRWVDGPVYIDAEL